MKGKINFFLQKTRLRMLYITHLSLLINQPIKADWYMIYKILAWWYLYTLFQVLQYAFWALKSRNFLFVSKLSKEIRNHWPMYIPYGCVHLLRQYYTRQFIRPYKGPYKVPCDKGNYKMDGKTHAINSQSGHPILDICWWMDG